MSIDQGGRLWIQLMNRHKVIRDCTVACTRDTVEEALREALPKLDLSQPMWLQRQKTDWKEYGMCTFKPEHFLEPVPFSQMTLTYLPSQEEQASRSSRARNPLEDA